MKRTWLKPLIGSVLIAASLLFFWTSFDRFRLVPWDDVLPLEFPSFSTSDGLGNSYVIDRSLKRVVKSSPEGKVVYVLNGGSRERDRFFFADEIAADKDGYLYLLNRIMDLPGFYTAATEIQKYTPEGKLETIVYRKEYTEADRVPTLIQRGHLMGLRVQDTAVTWLNADGKGLEFYSASLTGGTVAQNTVPGTEQADMFVSSADMSGGTIVWADKRGYIMAMYADGQSARLYDSDAEGVYSFPWKVRTDGKFVWFSDLGRKEIRRLDMTAAEAGQPAVETMLSAPILETLGIGPGDNLYYSLSLGTDGRIGTISDAGAFLLGGDGSGVQLTENPRFDMPELILGFMLWLAIFVAATGLILLVYFLYKDVMKGEIPRLLRTIAGVVILTGMVGGLVASLILNNFSSRYESEVLKNISQLVHLVPENLDTDKLMSIRDPSQFMNEDYQSIRDHVIRSVYGKDLERNYGIYFAIHRLKDDGQLYTFMWLNGEPSMWHPFSYLWDPELAYQSSLQGESVAYSSIDPWGSWMLATAPIRDSSGEIVGVFEMGGDFYSFTEENRRLVESLLVNIATVLIILLLVLVEAAFANDQMQKRNRLIYLEKTGREARRESDRYYPAYLMRPLNVLFYGFSCLSLLMLPLMMKALYEGQPEAATALFGAMPAGVVYALPLSVRLLFFGLGTLISGGIVYKIGWRALFWAGLLLSALGMTGAALFTDMIVFLIASALIGLGTGATTIAIRSVVNAEPDTAIRSKAFSNFYSGLIAGTILGVVVGSWLADFIGYANVFWGSVIGMFIVSFFSRSLLPHNEQIAEIPPRPSVTIRLAAFLGTPRVIGFFLLVVLPVYAISMVLGYVLPVWAGEQGVSNGDLGRIFLMNGLIIVYLGPPLAAMLRRISGSRGSLVTSTLVWIVSLLPFILMENLTGLIITIAIMGIAEGLAVPAQNDFYLSIDASEKFGMDRATGVFEVFGKIGETIAPIVLGFVMLLGPQTGLSVIAGTALALLLVYILLRGLGRRGAKT